MHGAQAALDEMRDPANPVDPRVVDFLENIATSMVNAIFIDLHNLLVLHEQELAELRRAVGATPRMDAPDTSLTPDVPLGAPRLVKPDPE